MSLLLLLTAAAPDAMIAPDAMRGGDVNAVVTLPDTVKRDCPKKRKKRKAADLAKKPARK